MRKKLIITAVILAILTIIAVSAVIARSAAVEKAFLKLSRAAEKVSWTAEIDPGSILSPTCIPLLTFKTPSGNSVTAKNICLDKGITTVLGDAPDISVTIGKVRGSAAESDIRNILIREKSASKDISKTSGSLGRLRASVTVGEIDMVIGDKGRQITVKAQNAAVRADRGQFSGSIAFTPGIDIARSPIAFRNLPHVAVEARYGTTERSGRADIHFTPSIAVAASAADHLIEAEIASVSANIDSGKWSACISGISASVPDPKYPVRLDIDSIQAQFEDGAPSKEALSVIRIDHPVLSVPTEKILASKKFQNNAMLSGLAKFWQQDAGAFLGKAPKKSVRREDVKKPRPKIRKNPISPETLQKIRAEFDAFRNKMAAIPSVDIQNGSVTLSHDTRRFTLDALSFNTADLFKKDSHQFELEFNMRSADVGFSVEFSDDSPFPEAHLKIASLAAPDFLRLINLPIPEKNSGDVTLDLTFRMSPDALTVIGSTEFKDFAFFHEKISPNVIHDFNAAARITAQYAFATDKLAVRPLEFTTGPIEASGFVEIANVRSDPVITFELGAKDIPCADIPKAIPAGFFPNITGLELAGTSMSPKIWGKIPWKAPLTSTLKASGFENRCIPTAVLPFHPEEVAGNEYTFTTPYTYFAEEITVGPGTESYTRLKNIPPYVRAAMYLTEDKRFFEHGPLRVSFIERALRLNLNQRSYVYGGSTIGQQLTKNLFLSRSKNIARKIEEAFITWHLVTHVPKSRLFELYINVIEFGPDIYGIKNAAKFYFDKLPSQLTPLEGAYLASLKVAPSNGGKFYKKGYPKEGRWWNKRLKYILKVLAENGYISPAEAIAANPWIPEFVYPEEGDEDDPRQIWLNQYTEYMKEKAKREREERKARENAE